MKRPWLILAGGLALALAAYAGSFYLASAPSRCLIESQTPELAWLQTEFRLSDPEFARICQLHESYRAACAERCRRIDAVNAEMKSLLASANTVTPAVEKALQEAAQLRAQCQKEMLQHFYHISRTMPPEQGRRYLSWVIDRTLGPAHAAMIPGPDDRAQHEQHHE